MRKVFSVKRLQAAMTKEGMTSSGLAGRLQVSVATVSLVLSGQRRAGAAFIEGLVNAFPEYDLRFFYEEEATAPGSAQEGDRGVTGFDRGPGRSPER